MTLMELVIVLFGGIAGGGLINGILPKASVNLWLSTVVGMVGGGTFYWVFMGLLMPSGAKSVIAADVGSLIALLAVGFAGGAFLMALVLLPKIRTAR